MTNSGSVLSAVIVITAEGLLASRLWNDPLDTLNLLLPAVACAFAFFFAVGQLKPVSARFQVAWLIIHLSLAFVYISYGPGWWQNISSSNLRVAAKFVTGAFVQLTLIPVFVPLGDAGRISWENRTALLVAVSGGASSAMYTIINSEAWVWLSGISAYCAHPLLRLMGLPVTTSSILEDTAEDGPQIVARIATESFGISVRAPCSGLEGIFLFVFVYSIMVLLDWRTLKGTRWYKWYAFGLVYMFAVNVLRIAAIMVVGVGTSKYVAPVFGRTVLIWFFHSYAGWVMYFIALLLFMIYFYSRLGPADSSIAVE